MRIRIPVVTVSRPVAGLLLAGTLLTTGAAHAQEPAVPPVPPIPEIPVSAVYVGDGMTLLSNRNAPELRKKVDFEVENMPIADAFRKLAERIGVACEVDGDVPKDRTITVTMKNVPASVVLGYLTQEAGVGYRLTRTRSGDRESVSLKIGKVARYGDFAIAGSPGQSTYTFRLDQERKARHDVDAFRLDRERKAQVEQAMRVAQDAIRLSTGPTLRVLGLNSAGLPDTRVKLDVRNADIRDALKDVLKQAEVDYALEEDVPENVKRSFTFENVPLATALEVICRSAEIGWTVRTPSPRVAGTKAGGAKTKPVILIGKKYANRLIRPLGMKGLLDFTEVPLAMATIPDFPLIESVPADFPDFENFPSEIMPGFAIEEEGVEFPDAPVGTDEPAGPLFTEDFDDVV
ncbi:MAG: hypothetical protein SFU56_08735 [Capsulimonadales bacterium]|nr:hypothetical protein [Capsulimonadales bacterium]